MTKIANNIAIRSLMDDPLMIGRHRPIVANWFQNWTEELTATMEMKLGEEKEIKEENIRHHLIKEIAKQIAPLVVFTETKICLSEGWRPGRPFVKDAPVAVQVRAALQGFRSTPKEIQKGAVSPTDSETVLSRVTPQPA